MAGLPLSTEAHGRVIRYVVRVAGADFVGATFAEVVQAFGAADVGTGPEDLDSR